MPSVLFIFILIWTIAADCNIHKLVLPQIVRILHIEVILLLLPFYCLAWSCCRCPLYLFTSFARPLHNVFVPDIFYSLSFSGFSIVPVHGSYVHFVLLLILRDISMWLTTAFLHARELFRSCPASAFFIPLCPPLIQHPL
jgi:hypothetical protein